MSNIESINVNPQLPLSKKLQGLKPYGAPMLDVKIRLNTNENPYPLPTVVKEQILKRLNDELENINRYPDRLQLKLRESIVRYLRNVTSNEVSQNEVWAANGSNEILNQILNAFYDPGAIALGFEPTYSMYKILSNNLGYEYLPIDRKADFSIDLSPALSHIERYNPRIIFIANPNNPTGNSISLILLEEILNKAKKSMVIVDEAYGEFSQQKSAISLIKKYSNLIITRTMSKAFAFAGARIGYAVGQQSTLAALGLVRLPYHLSAQSQVLAEVALENFELLQAQVKRITLDRTYLEVELAKLGLTVMPSDANFFLLGAFKDHKKAWQALVDESILVRDVGIEEFLRVTVGTTDESHLLVSSLKGLIDNGKIEINRKADR